MKKLLLLIVSMVSLSGATYCQDAVNLFTGDFNHSVPIMTVPSSNGPAIPVSLNYSAGVRVLQEASWVGQGWNLNMGEISRQLNGVPDDWRGQVLKTKVYDKTPSGWVEDTDAYDQTAFYGPVWFKDFTDSNPLLPTTASMDTYISRGIPFQDTDLASFEYPDYDEFYMTAPNAKGGVFKAFLFEDKGGYMLHKKVEESAPNANDEVTETVDANNVTDHSAQFLFLDDQTPISPPTFKAEKTHYIVNGVQYCNGIINQSGNYTGNFNADGTVQTGRQIKYYTNQEIFQANGNLPGFIECPEMQNNRNPINGTPSYGIGAFSIKMTSGYTYHYSLPVYRTEEVNYSLEKDNNGDFTKLRATIKTSRFATSWKLTAVTGPDYTDNGPSGIDASDSGYWVSYRYGKYADEQDFQIPFKGGNKSFNESPNYGSYNTLLNYEFKHNEAVTTGKSEVYYPEYIQTSSHTGVFVKSLRKDNYSPSLVPQLKLDKVVLLRNEDANLLINQFAASGFQTVSGLSTSNVFLNQITHDGVWNTQYNTVKDKVLGAMDFTYDYSLMPGHYHNIENTLSSSQSESHTDGVVNLNYERVSVNGNGGVLTLKSVKNYGYQYESEIPAQTFSYGFNPAFASEKEDIWGFYKSDYVSGTDVIYSQIPTTSGQDAWSLSETKSPTGGRMVIHYESDRYKKVGTTPIQRAFEIKDVQLPGNDLLANLTMAPEFYDFICRENNNGNLDKIFVRQPLHYSGNNCSASLSVGTGMQEYTPNPNLEWGPGVIHGIDCNSQSTQLYIASPYPSTNCTVTPVPSNVASESGSIVLHLNEVNGGGIRVKAIETINGDGTSYKSKYNYDGGVASTEPERIVPANFGGILKNYVLYNRLDYSPAVGYSKVTMTVEGSHGIDAPGKTEYHYTNYTWSATRVYKSESLSKKQGTAGQITCGDVSEYLNDPHVNHIQQYISNEVLTADDWGKARAGRLERKTIYDEHDNILSSVQNFYADYLTKGETFRCNKETKIEKWYNPYFSQGAWADKYHIPITINSVFTRRYNHSVLSSQVSVSNGNKVITEFLDYNPYTGLPTKTKSFDQSTGEWTTVTSIPAYTLSQYSNMGLTSIDPLNQNFLSQVADQSLELNDKFQDGLYKTFSKTIPVRKKVNGEFITQNETKSWMTDKVYVYNGQSDKTNWRKQVENTLFNEKGVVIEARGYDDRYGAKKFGYNNQYPIVSLSNARYEEFTACGAEDLDGDYFGGEVALGDGVIITDPNYTHSGSASVKLVQQQTAFEYNVDASKLKTDRTYEGRVWVKNGNNYSSIRYRFVDQNGATITTQEQLALNAPMEINGWKQLIIDITIPTNLPQGARLIVECFNYSTTPAYFDDFRFHPKDKPLTSYLYDPTRGLVTHVLDNNNMYSKMEYDMHGRLIKTFVEDENGEQLVTETEFNIKQ